MYENTGILIKHGFRIVLLIVDIRGDDGHSNRSVVERELTFMPILSPEGNGQLTIASKRLPIGGLEASRIGHGGVEFASGERFLAVSCTDAGP